MWANLGEELVQIKIWSSTLFCPIRALSQNTSGLLALGLSNGTVDIYSRHDDKWDVKYTIPAHACEVTTLSWSDNKLATGGRDRILNIFELSDDCTRFHNIFQMKIHSGTINCVHWVFQETGPCLVSAGSDRTICYIERVSDEKWAVSTSIKTALSPYCITGSGPFIAIGKSIQLFNQRKLLRIFTSSKCTRTRYDTLTTITF